MRTVASNTHEVFHAWANQSQSNMRCGNVSFNDGTLCSYAAPIAEIYNDTDGNRIYVVSRYNYSVTTSGHQSAARRAIPRNELLLTVSSRLSDHGSLEALLRVEIEGHVMTERLLKIKRSRTYQHSLYNELAEDLEKYREIARRAGLTLTIPETPTLEGVSGLASEVIAQRKETERLAGIEREKAEAERLIGFRKKLMYTYTGARAVNTSEFVPVVPISLRRTTALQSRFVTCDYLRRQSLTTYVPVAHTNTRMGSRLKLAHSIF